MNTVSTLFAQPWAERLGWTLLHFLWQGLAIAVLYAAVRALLARTASVHTQYALACAALAAMACAPAATFLYLTAGAPGNVAAAAIATSAAPLPASITTAAWNPPGVLAWIVMAWLAGAAFFSLRLLGGCWSASRLRRAGTRPAPAEWQRVLDRLARPLGVARPVRLLVSSLVETPTVVGWLRPLVLAPVGALTGLAPEHVEALLAHELAHIRRHDYAINVLQGVVEAILFYHPAVWWLSRRIRMERELCCDDLAVAASASVLTYAAALAELERCRPSRTAPALAANGGSLALRIRRILGQPARDRVISGRGAAWALTAALLVGVGAMTVRTVIAQEPSVERSSVWTDTVKFGDLQVEVRALGTLQSSDEVALKFAESHASEVQVGQNVTLDSRTAGLFTGRVARVAPRAENGTVTVTVQVNGTAPVQPGAKVDGSIVIRSLSNVDYVGRPVFGAANSAYGIFKLDADGKHATRVRVQFGAASVNSIQVLSGLQPGEQIILSDMSAFDRFDHIAVR